MSDINNLHEKWLEDPKYKDAYTEMSDEFVLASAIITARDHAGLTQDQLATKMRAKQSLIARLESGSQNTTIKTLQRIAEATGTHLKISFE